MAGNAWKFLLTITKKHRNMFIKYLLLVICKLCILGYLEYSALLSIYAEFTYIRSLFALFVLLTFVEVYRRYLAHRTLITCEKILYVESYNWLFNRMLRTDLTKLKEYNADSLSCLIAHGASAPNTYFQIIVLSTELSSTFLLFSLVAISERFSNVVFIVAGFGLAYLVLETPIYAKINVKYLEDVAGTGSLLWDSVAHGEQQLIENRIIDNLVNSEREKLALSAGQDLIVLRAYLILIICMCAMLYRTVNLSDLSSILIHVYILTDLAGMIDKYVILRMKLRNMVISEIMLEKLNSLPVIIN